MYIMKFKECKVLRRKSLKSRKNYLKVSLERNCSPQSRLRVVIATAAFGMGINCPDVSQIIHLRSPCSLLNYGQESGRCGRDGREPVAKLYHSNREFGICSLKSNRKTTKYQSEICDLLKMKSYASNKSECHLLLLLHYFVFMEKQMQSRNFKV